MRILARVVRASTLVVREQPFVAAARARGVSSTGAMIRHVLPNAIGPALVQATVLMGFAIQVEAALSFLGLGVEPPTPSLGLMLLDGYQVLQQAWWVDVFPGLAIAITVLAFMLLGDGFGTVDPSGCRSERARDREPPGRLPPPRWPCLFGCGRCVAGGGSGRGRRSRWGVRMWQIDARVGGHGPAACWQKGVGFDPIRRSRPDDPARARVAADAWRPDDADPQDPLSALDPAFSIGGQIAETIRAHRDISARQARARASSC